MAEWVGGWIGVSRQGGERVFMGGGGCSVAAAAVVWGVNPLPAVSIIQYQYWGLHRSI